MHPYQTEYRVSSDEVRSGIRKKIVVAHVDDVERIALAIILGQDLHNDSYVKDHLYKRDSHTRSRDECFKEACATCKVDPRLVVLIGIADYWYNDIRAWADEVLSGEAS